MAEETIDKSIVVWHPNSLVPDVREWTQLFLLYDRVLLCPLTNDIGMEYVIQKRHLQLGRSETMALRKYHAILLLFREYGLLQVIDFSEQEEMFNQFLRTETDGIPNKLHKQLMGLPTYSEEGEDKRPIPLSEFIKSQRVVKAYHAYIASKAKCLPLVTDDQMLHDPNDKLKTNDALTSTLAQSAICQFALPDVKAIHVDNILEARNELKDELLEFRAGILKLTWLLHQQVQNKNDLGQIRQEADTLVNTVIKGSLLSLENRMRQHKRKGIRRMLFGTGRVIVEATKLFLPSGAAEKMISGGKGLLQLATEIDSAKLPEDQIATYLYKLRGKLKI